MIATGSSCWCASVTAAASAHRAVHAAAAIQAQQVQRASAAFHPRAQLDSGGSRKNSPDWMACEIRTMSCGTTGPRRGSGVRLRCCRSVPRETTASPDALSNVRGALAQRRCHTGVDRARPLPRGRDGSPSRRARSGRPGCAAHASLPYWRGCNLAGLRALPVVLGLVTPPVAHRPRRYRVTTGRRLVLPGAWWKAPARLARGAVLMGGETKATGRGSCSRAGSSPPRWADAARRYDSRYRAPEENLRSAPRVRSSEAPRVLLNKVAEGTSGGRWVPRDGACWAEKTISNRRAGGELADGECRYRFG